MQACHISDMTAAVIIVALCAAWLLTTVHLRRRTSRAKQRVAAMTLELVGANHRLEQARAQVTLLAHHDPLTGLLVRAELQRGFQSSLALAKRTDAIFAMILIDLPGFEAVSARYGDEIADRMLAAFGQRLRSVTRDMDMVARVGDYQFAALLPRLNATDDIDIVIRKLRTQLERPFILSGQPDGFHIQTCFGHASFPRDGKDWTSMMKMADERLARGRVLVRA